MRANMAATLGNGIEDLCHAMTDVIPHDIFHEQSRQQDSHHGIEQVEVMHACRLEIARQEMLDEMDQLLQDQRSHGRAQAYDEAEDQDEIPLLDMLLPPQQELEIGTDLYHFSQMPLPVNTVFTV